MKIQLVSVLFFLFSLVASHGATFLTFGGKGYINQGKTFLLSAENGYRITVSNGWFENKTKSEASFTFERSSSGPSSQWEIVFAAPKGQPLTVGTNYLGVTRYPFAEDTMPSLDLGGDGRGSNELTGWFKVLELTWTPEGQIATAAFDFLHLSEGNASSWTLGSLRYNSDIPASPVPEPSVTLLALFTITGLVVRRKR